MEVSGQIDFLLVGNNFDDTITGTLSSSTDAILDDAASLLDQRDPAGRTALMLAASEGHTNLIELFLDKGSVLESRDKEGLTALCWACVRGRLAAVQNLIDHGADVNTNDNTGRTPLDLAAFQVRVFHIYLLSTFIHLWERYFKVYRYCNVARIISNICKISNAKNPKKNGISKKGDVKFVKLPIY